MNRCSVRFTSAEDYMYIRVVAQENSSHQVNIEQKRVVSLTNWSLHIECGFLTITNSAIISLQNVRLLSYTNQCFSISLKKYASKSGLNG